MGALGRRAYRRWLTPNQWTERLDSDEVLAGIIGACRHYRRLPTNAEIDLLRKSDPAIPSNQAIRRHFGTRATLLSALAQWTTENDDSADIIAMLPAVLPTPTTVASTKARQTDGFVYLLKSGDHYKVGRSENLERRIKEVGISLPEAVILVHSIRTDDPSGIEAYWHRRFADKRSNGEWFKLTSLDISAFKKRKYQ